MNRFKNTIVIAWLLLIFFAATWSLYRPGFFRTHDYVHVARMVEMLTGAQEGQLPVRWSGNFGYGYGMPLFEFYAPLPYYVGAFLLWLGLPAIEALRMLFFIATAGTVLGGYLLGEKFFGRIGGILTSAALTLAPYRAVNLFVRGALAESWGSMFTPWLLFGGVLLVKADTKQQKWFSWLVITLSTAGLLLTHNLTALMFVPVAALFTTVLIISLYWLKQSTWFNQKAISFNTVIIRVLMAASAYIYGLALAAFYVFPAILEKGFTQIDSILSGYFNYAHHFLYIRQFFSWQWGYGGSEWGPNDGISFFLGFGQLIGVLLLGWLFLKHIFFVPQKHAQWKRSHIWFLWVTGVSVFFLLVSLYLSLLKAQFIWDAIPFFSFIQFPWRWLEVAIVMLALLVGSSVVWIKHRIWRYLYMVVLLVPILANAVFFRPEKYADNPNDYYYTDPQLIRTNMSSILPDFMPIDLQVSPDISGIGLPVNTNAQVLLDTDSTLGMTVENESVLINRAHQKLLRVKSPVNRTLTFAIANFPGWMAEVDGTTIPTSQSDQGLLQVSVPSGEHVVGVYLGKTPVRAMADMTSTVAIVGLLSTLFLVSLKKKAL